MKFILIILFYFLFCKEDLKKTEQEKSEAKIEQSIKSETETVYEYNSYIVKAKSGLKMRKSPNLNSEVIQTIPKNAIAFKVEDTNISHESEGKKGAWVKVVYRLNVGFVFDGFLEKNLSNRNLVDSTFVEEISLWHNYEKESELNLESGMEIQSDQFIFAPQINSKIYFYPFSKKVKSPIELKVKSVKYEEIDFGSKIKLDEGFIMTPENENARFLVEFEYVKDKKILKNLVNSNQKHLSGLIIYPPVKSFSCLNKINLKKVKLPYRIDFLEFAIDLDNDKKPDILKYNIIEDDIFYNRTLLIKIDHFGGMEYLQDYSYRSGSTDPVEYLCDEK